MNVDVYLPPPIQHILDGAANPYTYNKDLMTRVHALGAFTTRCCTKALQEEAQMEQLLAEEREDGDDEPPDIQPSFLATNAAVAQSITKLYNAWMRYYVISTAQMQEILDLKMPPDGHAYKTTLGAHVFYELTRLHWLLAQPQLMLERENVVRIPSGQWVASEYDLMFALAHTRADVWTTITTASAAAAAAAAVTKKDTADDTEPVHVTAARELRQNLMALWTTPIMQYTASQVRILAAFLTQHINEVGESTMNEYRRVFRVLWLRSAVLSIPHGWDQARWPQTLDDADMRTLLPSQPPGAQKAVANRAWSAYCSFYLGELVRRFYHYDILAVQTEALRVEPEAVSAAAVERVKHWITHAVVGTFAEEAFEEIHQTVVTELGGAYDFPGDGQWFRYANPSSVATLGATITQLRPHLYDRFFSEEQVDRTVILGAVPRSHLARLFVLHALDAYIKITHARVEFLNGVVIDNGGIEQSAYALKTGVAPLLLQVFGRYWVYWRGRIHISDDLWTTLALWWWLLREYCDNKLYGIDLSVFATEALLARAQHQDVPVGGGGQFEL